MIYPDNSVKLRSPVRSRLNRWRSAMVWVLSGLTAVTVGALVHPSKDVGRGHPEGRITRGHRQDDLTIGTILADGNGITLYTLMNNGQPVLCTGTCATIWPPLTVASSMTPVTGPAGVTGLATVSNANGSAVTFQGAPLYRFAFDHTPSDVNGDGIVSFGGTWHMVSVSMSSTPAALNKPVVGMAATPDGMGYWLVASDGGIFAFGDAGFYGSTGAMPLNKPIVGMATTADGKGYWLVASDGGIFAFGDARFYGSTGGMPLNKPIVGMAATPDGKGYWLVASDGGIFAFGDAVFYGSTGGMPLNKPIVGMAATPDGKGYWLVASDGGIFAFGDARFYGSTGAIPLNKPIVGMAATPTARATGWWPPTAGSSPSATPTSTGRPARMTLNKPIVGMATTPDGKGYWLVASDGGIFAFGDAVFYGAA